jgi:hypothetical protein
MVHDIEKVRLAGNRRVRCNMRVKLWPPITLCAITASLSLWGFVPMLRAQNAANPAAKPDSPGPSDTEWHVIRGVLHG